MSGADLIVIAPKGGRWRGRRHWPEGTTLVAAEDMDDEVLAALQADAAFVIIEREAGPAAPADPQVVAAPADEAVAAAIRQLGRNAFTADGVPKMDPIRAGFGKAEGKLITQEQRDRVFAEMTAIGFELPSVQTGS